MLFNSFEFFLFFPTVVAIYFAIPHRARTLWLLAASCVFYMAFVPIYLLILLFTIVVDYYAGLAIERSVGSARHRWLLASIIANVGVLAVFKYAVFAADNINAVLDWAGVAPSFPVLRILLPIGLSFHTFQAMSYTIEVYRGTQPAERSFPTYALYVMFFPQLVAGPIERPQNLLPQFKVVRRFDPALATAGLRLMLWGFVKKIAVADRLAPYVDAVYGNPLAHTPIANAIATVFFAFQIYCDFSGYSDIAIGSAKVMGFRLMTNFRQPYFAMSISDFWRRWHISLSTWFRDYVYIPLGGNRKGLRRTTFNLLVVFVLSGLWHGANWTFLIWGAIHGMLLVIQQAFGRLRERYRLPSFTGLGGMVLTFLVVNIAWVFFRAGSLDDASRVLGRIFSPWYPVHGIMRPLEGVGGREDMILCGIGILTVLVVDFAIERNGDIQRAVLSLPRGLRWTVYYAAAMALLLFGAWGKREFIYFQF